MKMKMKMFLGISMVLAALILLAPPATAAGTPHGTPGLSDFLASLAPAPVDAAKRPAIRGEKALCVVAANCAGGGTVNCSGYNSVTSCSGTDGNCSINEPGHVTCDGVTTWCANTCFSCDFEEQSCADNCNPCSYSFTCDPVTQTSHCHCNFRTCLQ